MGDTKRTFGEIAADKITSVVGSWAFIIIQSSLLAMWMFLNSIHVIKHWDSYPFILLNLVLSFQAAFATPIIMMAQNRQSDIDRKKVQEDLDIDFRTEQDIQRLNEKVDRILKKLEE